MLPQGALRRQGPEDRAWGPVPALAEGELFLWPERRR